MNAWDIVSAATPFIVPLLLAGVAATLTPAFTTARRLRQELAAETGMLERLPPSARAELRTEIRRRTLILVSITRYPPLSRNDVLAISGFILTMLWAGLSIAELWTQGEPDVMPILAVGGFTLTLVLGLSSWLAFHLPWSSRALGRLKYVSRHLGHEAARDLVVGLRVVWSISFLGGFIVTVAVLTAFVMGGLKSHGMDPALGAFAAMLLFPLLLLLFQRIDSEQGLLGEILKYNESFQWDLARAMEAEERRAAKRSGKSPRNAAPERRFRLWRRKQ